MNSSPPRTTAGKVHTYVTVQISVSDLDPDPCDLYWKVSRGSRSVLGTLIRIKDSKNYAQKGKNLRFLVEKRMIHVAEGLMVFT